MLNIIFEQKGLLGVAPVSTGVALSPFETGAAKG